MTLLVVFFAGLFVLVALFVVALLAEGFRPQRSRRSRNGYSSTIQSNDGSGGTSS